MNVVTNRAPRISVPIIPASLLRDVAIAVLAAVALAAAFPKAGVTWLVPAGLAALFWTWQGASWKRAALLGWVAGFVFFAIAFDWIGHTVGNYIGAYGPFLMFAPALVEAPFLALAGALSAVAYRRVDARLAPLAAAAAFTICEWLRSIGALAVPFDQLGYTQTDGPLRAIAAYAGSFGVTFALCVLGAYLADAIHRRAYRPFAIAIVVVALSAAGAWLAWPARRAPAPSIPVAAVQGNIAQSLKWNSLGLAIERYSVMTRVAAARKPRLIVWPETVIPTDLTLDSTLATGFEQLSRNAKATIVIGSVEVSAGTPYNALFVFQPWGGHSVYRKRQLVPFAESFPGRAFLSWLPYVGRLSGGFGAGTSSAAYPTAALPIAPLICWESAFADLALAQIRSGAQLLVVSTDDAWFGTTSEPYMHAQIAQMLAIESGAYVVRAAATGISGIINPDGSWQTRGRMEEMTTQYGLVGPRAPTVYSRLGPTAIALVLIVLYSTMIVVWSRPSTALAQTKTSAHGDADK
ncbi:MAG: apolipoprotein N-acyltransferase [Candidatus Eremiobacteraeota bacterium]|nr:apolipoprotein N-acyltransferase [Candidatus Eremiobacteraeota bacterium]